MSDVPLDGRELIVAVCGGISAYKMADVVSKLVQAGAGVTVCMTEAAGKFITPLTFESLSGRKVRTDAWNLADSTDPQHIALTENADLMLVGAATANTLARVAHGFCDDLVSLTHHRRGVPGGLRAGDERPDVGQPDHAKQREHAEGVRLPLHRPRGGLAGVPQRRRGPIE